MYKCSSWNISHICSGWNIRAFAQHYLNPLTQPATIFLQQKSSRAKTFSEDAMRFLITPRARNPLLPHLILRRSEPFLRQHLHQPRLQIQNKERECRIVIRHRLVAGRHDQLIHRRQFRRHFDLVHARPQPERHFKLRDRSGLGVDAIRRLLEPPGNLSQVKPLKLIRIETRDPNVPPLRTPDPQPTRRGKKWPAVGIQREPHLVRLLLGSQRDHVRNRPLLALMRPRKLLSRRRLKRRKRLPVPWRGTNGVLKLLPDVG